MIIGNELLSGKVADRNTPYLTRRLWELGVEVRRVEIVPDEPDEIARAVREASERFDVVLTSGGVGPTHDDVTMEGVARAFGCGVTRHSFLENRLSRLFGGEELTAARARLADIPDGARLLVCDDHTFPQVVMENVYIFPGIPQVLQERFEAVADEFQGDPVELRKLYLEAEETRVAPILNRAVRRFPSVRYGSYPFQDPSVEDPVASWRVLVTCEGRDLEVLEEAYRFLLESFPAEMNPTSERPSTAPV